VLCVVGVVLGLLAGCPAPTEPGGETSPARTGGSTGSKGTGGSGSGGSAGTGGAATGGASGTGGGSGGSSAGTGGTVGGTGGTTADAGADVPATGTGGTTAGTGGSSPADAGDAPSSSPGDEFGNVSLPDKPWIRLCAKDATQAQCCDMLCKCLNKHCADSPADQANIAKCNNLCMGYGNMAMRCHVYHCFESLNPKVPKDHASHCGHASNRSPGGGCPTAVYQ
jgi:hypothetical protein